MPPASIRNRIDITLPSDGMLINYFYVFKQKGMWKLWLDVVRRQDAEMSSIGIFVATADTACFNSIMEMHIKVKFQF